MIFINPQILFNMGPRLIRGLYFAQIFFYSYRVYRILVLTVFVVINDSSDLLYCDLIVAIYYNIITWLLLSWRNMRSGHFNTDKGNSFILLFLKLQWTRATNLSIVSGNVSIWLFSKVSHLLITKNYDYEWHKHELHDYEKQGGTA